MSKGIYNFINDQLSRWPLACGNFRALKHVHIRDLKVGRLSVKAQFNPARIISSAAKTDNASLKKRPCFLCPENRPKEQIFRRFDGRKGKKYDILVNPYPVFSDHLVVAFHEHTEQSIWHRFVDLLDLSKTYQDFIFFYNGPKSGASAPDHHHFQAAGRGRMPLENDVDKLLDAMNDGLEVPPGAAFGAASRSASGTASQAAEGTMDYVTSVQDADLFHYKGFTTGVFVLRGRTVKSTAKLFYRLLDCSPVLEGDTEPRFNLFTYFKGGEYRAIVVFRTQHRSHHYFSDGPDHLTMSPGCVDMCGLFIVPMEEDYKKLDSALLTDMLREVTLSQEDESLIIKRLTRSQRLLEVGIMSAREIEFEIDSDGAGIRRAVWHEGKIEYDGALYDELYFEAKTLSTMFAEPTFILHGVTIGVGFHWERTESQKFAGALKIIVEGEKLTAVNIIGVEDYLLSVISSEMKSTASPEFLKAHAVISRSWVMAQLELREQATGTAQTASEAVSEESGTADERHIVKWYGRGQHENYDVCADDHCQRYQGLTRAVGKGVRDAIDATCGEILTYNGKICDARFAKCCGGVTEQFSTCWEDVDFPYLPALPDTPGHVPVADGQPAGMVADGAAEAGSGTSGGSFGAVAFCNTSDKEILDQVLNSYDLETKDFYQWTVRYGREEISELIEKNTGWGIGLLTALEPLERGESGRIRLLRLRGSKGRVVVGKELEIRRILSDSHLKSSAFEPHYLDAQGREVQFSDDWTALELSGKGWGHGVGLCQIGAAVMAAQGYTYRQILQHYYPGAEI